MTHFLLRFAKRPDILPIVLLAIFQKLAAQPQTLTLPEVQVSADRWASLFNTATLHRPDTALKLLNTASSAAEVFSKLGLFFKTYGSGGLATSGFRGTGAGHSTVVWNGFNIKNPMNGVIDFSLFPLGLSSEVLLFEGGGSSLYGNGAIGGTLMLNDLPAFTEGLQAHLHLSAGSFSDFRQRATLNFAKKNTAALLNLWHHAAKNDFPVRPGNYRQPHAALKHTGISQSIRLRLGQHNELNTFVWMQNVSRQLPPSRTETSTDAQQDDQVLRLGTRWTRLHRSGSTTLQAGYFREQLLFFSNLIDSSRSHSNTWVADFIRQHHSDHSKLVFKLQGQHQNAHSPETGLHRRNTLAAVAGWKYYSSSEKTFLEAFLRQELTDGKMLPPTGSAGLTLNLNRSMAAILRIGRSYNLPTFNDLYWQDAFAKGNPNLKPEHGFGLEGGLKMSSENYFVDLRLHSTWVTDKITWRPKDGIWMPENQKQLWSRGVSMKVGLHHSAGKWKFSHNAFINLNRSTEASRRAQISYMPLLTASCTAMAQIGKNKAVVQCTYTSRIYTTSDQNTAESEAPTTLLHLHLIKTWLVGATPVSTTLSVNNLLNTTYEIINARPMPGRSFRVALGISL